MEREIGEKFNYKGKTIEVVIDNFLSCNNCCFKDTTCYDSQIGKCLYISRSDGKSVIFKEVGK